MAGAARYRIRIYDDRNNSLFAGYTGRGETQFTVPPGVLQPNAMYRYRLEAWDSIQPGNLANLSRTPASSSDYYIFYTPDTESVDPMIDLDRHGAVVWNDELFGVLPRSLRG